MAIKVDTEKKIAEVTYEVQGKDGKQTLSATLDFSEVPIEYLYLWASTNRLAMLKGGHDFKKLGASEIRQRFDKQFVNCSRYLVENRLTPFSPEMRKVIDSVRNTLGSGISPDDIIAYIEEKAKNKKIA